MLRGRSAGIHHVDLAVSNLERSLGFYRTLLGPLGCHGVSYAPGARGETIHYLYGPGSSLGLRQAREALEAADATLDELGAQVTDGPREFPEYRPGYNALYFTDPDGIKLELVWTPPDTYAYLDESS